jgi:FtsP/CotA-like multicopper oxidase with cupredoxin domain
MWCSRFGHFAGLVLLGFSSAHAKVVEYDLQVAEARWSPESGMKASRALTLNGGIPGPTLRFREGDTARIRVKNLLKREETSIHWHGLLVPNSQDGVPYVNTPPIQAGETRVFEFPLRQAGTYWYHSHTELQEQSGVYGSIVIEPKNGERVKVDRDHVVVLSDWTRENPHEVMRSLMRGSDWYAFNKGAMQSVFGAAKAGFLADFWDRERSRIPAMDVSDVAYDAFLANGKRSIDLKGKPGERIRLRFINAGAATYFYLQSATGPMTLIGSDGKDVKPFQIKRLLIGMAETYDVVVRVPPSGRWEIRATSQDGTGHASMWIGSGDVHSAPEVPKPELYNMDAHLMAAMDEEEATGDEERPLSPYRRVRAVHCHDARSICGSAAT